jgi:hypothetical protein
LEEKLEIRRKKREAEELIAEMKRIEDEKIAAEIAEIGKLMLPSFK